MMQETTSKILTCLLTADNALSPKEISEKTGVSHNYVKKRLRELEREGKVVRLQRGKYLISDLGVTFVKPIGSPIESLVQKLEEIDRKLDLILQKGLASPIKKEGKSISSDLLSPIKKEERVLSKGLSKKEERPSIKEKKGVDFKGFSKKDVPDFVRDNPWAEIIKNKKKD